MSGTIVVSQFGARMHYAVPRILEQAGMLERLYTDICAVRGWPRLLRTVPKDLLPRPLRRLGGRIPEGIPPAKITCFEMIGLSAVASRMLDDSQAGETATALASARRFSLAVVGRGFGEARGFYGISGECLEQIEAARAQGLRTAVEQIVAPKKILDRLVQQEFERHPGWEPTIGDDPGSSAFADREKAEWDAADLIVCPSSFVRDGVRAAGGPAERCVVVPYGIDARFRLPERSLAADRPLRVLTVGAAGLRKGTPYVLEAALRMRGRASFRLVGPVPLPATRRVQLSEALDMTGQVPRSEIMAHYEWADLFLLPSVCEGSATVIYEALAAGLPVITTPNAGSVVRDGIDGFLCPAGDIDAICKRIGQLNRDRDLLAHMSRHARATARDYDLAGYGRRLLATLAPIHAAAQQVDYAL